MESGFSSFFRTMIALTVYNVKTKVTRRGVPAWNYYKLLKRVEL